MSSSNENNMISFENSEKTKNKNSKYYEEIDLIASNPKISSTIDSSGVLEEAKNTSNKISVISINSSIPDSDLIYGSPINIFYPRKIGKMKAFFYIYNFPLIVIGPDCKYF